MPTRAFGDFTLKYEEFNNPQNLDRSLGWATKFNAFFNSNPPCLLDIQENCRIIMDHTLLTVPISKLSN